MKENLHKMTRIIAFALLACAFSLTSSAVLIPEGEPVTSVDGTSTLYRLEENGIHYYYVYAPFEDGTGKVRSTYQFYLMYHDEDIDAPFSVQIPSEFVWNGSSFKVEGYLSAPPSFDNVKTEFSEKQITFNKVCFPKEVYPPRNEDGSLKFGSYHFQFLKSVNVSDFSVDKDNPGLSSPDGVLMSKDEDIIIRYPVCSKRVNYYVPESVAELRVGCFSGVTVPVFLNDNCKEKPYDPAFDNYPFYGLYGRTGVLDNSLYLKNAAIKAFDNANIEVFPENAVAISFLPYEVGMDGLNGSKELVFEKYIFSNIYNTPEIDGTVRTVEFTYPDDVTIKIVGNLDSYEDAVFDEDANLAKITTYVSAAQKPSFEAMYERRNFPQNVIIKETPDRLYLYPELCHGPWVNKQSQFVYGLCRFGDSQLAGREWDTDNHDIATIDESGLLTAYKTGSVKVTLKCTDEKGNGYDASEVINITEKDFLETGIAETVVNQDVYPRGVYNLQGMKVSDRLEGLPKGIYIYNGKKIAIR